MRERQISIGSKEDIIEYTHHVGIIVRCLVGHGEINEYGDFIPTPSQNYEIYEISGEAYESLIAADPETGKPAGVFRKDDLWTFIDGARNQLLNPPAPAE